MSLIADLFVKLGLKSDDYTKGLDKAKKDTNMFSSTIGKIGGMIAGAFAVSSIISWGKSAVNQFNLSEQAATRLLVALKGNVSAQDMLIKQAEELQKTTLFEDDETVAAQAAIGMIVKEADKIKILIPLVQDLATAKGMDLSSAAFMVAKAVNGSAVALEKMGIQVEGTAGSAERFTSIVNGLNEKVGGQAAAAAKVGSGALTILANEWGNVAENMGKVIVRSGIFKQSVAWLTSLASDISSGKQTKRGLWSLLGFDSFETAKGKFDSEMEKLEKDFRKIQADLNKEEEGKKTESPFLTEIQQLKLRMDSLNKTIEASKQELGTLDPKTDEWKTAWDALKGYREELEEIRKLLTSVPAREKNLAPMIGARGESTLAVPETKVEGLGGLNKAKESEAAARKMVNDQILEDEERYQEDLNNIIAYGMSNAIESMASGLAELAVGNIGGKEFGQQILTMVGSFMVQLGLLMITTSKLFTAWKTSLAAGGWGSIGFGIALVVAGAAVGALARKGPGGGGSGGGAASGYSGAQSQSSGANAMGGKVVFELHGNVLKGALANTDRRNYNMG